MAVVSGAKGPHTGWGPDSLYIRPEGLYTGVGGLHARAGRLWSLHQGSGAGVCTVHQGWGAGGLSTTADALRIGSRTARSDPTTSELILGLHARCDLAHCPGASPLSQTQYTGFEAMCCWVGSDMPGLDMGQPCTSA